MGYEEFSSGTVINPYQINQNFHALRVGDFMPRTDAAMTVTDGEDDLGAVTTAFISSNFRDIINDSFTARTDDTVVRPFTVNFVLTATSSVIEISSEAGSGWGSTTMSDMEVYFAGAIKPDSGRNLYITCYMERYSAGGYLINNTYWDTSASRQLWETAPSQGWRIGYMSTGGFALTMTSFLLKMSIRAFNQDPFVDDSIMVNHDMAWFQEDGVVNVNQGAARQGGSLDKINYITFHDTNTSGFQPGSYIGIWNRK